MAATKEVIREAVLKHGVALDDILSEANQKTAIASTELEGEGGVFVTAFIGVLDLRSGRLIYTSAGHEAPFVVGSDRGLRQLITEGGPPLGAVAGFLYPIDRDRIAPGEVLLLYTDGVTEAENADHTLYGRDRLTEALANGPANDARNLVAAVIDDVHRFIGGSEPADDVTVLALRRANGVVI